LIGHDHKLPHTLDKKVLKYRTPLLSSPGLGALPS
jgi:hypothetical protein